MGKLFDFATEQHSLWRAWHRIRSNGLNSASHETREAIELFGHEENRNIIRIQKRLRDGSFEFDPQKGVLKKKKSSGHRGIVLASVQNRIVERSLLDCLQSKSETIKKVISQPTSVGGVPNRSVPHGLKLVSEAFAAGNTYFVRSDISGFFDGIPRMQVIDRISQEIKEEKFLKLLDAATTVVLANEKALGEDRRVFPTDDQGVAQGSPLSPLFGNILLNDFDQKFNGRGILCVRFIDDFVLLGDNEGNVRSAFESAKEYLSKLGLECHDPFKRNTNFEKAEHGSVEDGFVFLGYDIRPGQLQPSKAARQSLEKRIASHIWLGQRAILGVRSSENSFEFGQRYAQTLALVDKVVRGWGEAFAYSNAPNTMEDLDRRIDRKLSEFKEWFAELIAGADWKTKRRLGGVGLLSDIKAKELNDVPFTLDQDSKFRRDLRTVTISTDGAVVGEHRRKGKDQGVGGWAYVVHDQNVERAGSLPSATNNQMELLAVVEAIASVEANGSVIIRTDSKYVFDAVNKNTVLKSNRKLWDRFRELSATRKVKVVWVKGHAGDVHNERADHLASNAANTVSALAAA
jgi:RNA-directed DNA polymerase